MVSSRGRPNKGSQLPHRSGIARPPNTRLSWDEAAGHPLRVVAESPHKDESRSVIRRTLKKGGQPPWTISGSICASARPSSPGLLAGKLAVASSRFQAQLERDPLCPSHLS